MKEKNKQLRKMMAKKMIGYKFRTNSKELSRDWFKAMVNKKALPKGTRQYDPTMRYPKNSEYSKMSIKEFEKKYL